MTVSNYVCEVVDYITLDVSTACAYGTARVYHILNKDYFYNKIAMNVHQSHKKVKHQVPAIPVNAATPVTPLIAAY